MKRRWGAPRTQSSGLNGASGSESASVGTAASVGAIAAASGRDGESDALGAGAGAGEAREQAPSSSKPMTRRDTDRSPMDEDAGPKAA